MDVIIIQNVKMHIGINQQEKNVLNVVEMLVEKKR